MIYIDFETINREFMEFVCERSRYVSFLTPKDTTGNSFAAMNLLLKEWEPYLLRSYCDTVYLNSEFGEEYRVLLYEMNDKIKEKLVHSDGLAEWRYPEWPEDPCFFDEHEACWFKTVVHEEIAEIFDEGELPVDEIAACGIDFDVWENWESEKPRLDDPETIEQRAAERRKREAEAALRTARYKERVAPVLVREGFQVCGDAFYRIIDNQVLLLVEISDENIYFDAMPLCIGIDPGIRFPVVTFDVRSLLEAEFVEEVSEALVIDTFVNDVFARMCRVKDLKGAYDFHKFYLKNIEDEVQDEFLIYGDLWLEKYGDAFRTIKKIYDEEVAEFEEEFEEGYISSEELEIFKARLNDWQCVKLARLLEAHSYDLVRASLEKNRKENLKLVFDCLWS